MADDRTIKITLKQPFPLLIDAIAVQNSFIMPERLAKTDPFKAITEIVGSGPFRFLKDEFVAGSSAAWEKFDGYVPRQEPAEWTSGGKVAHFQRIEWKIIPDAATASAALQSGEVDWYEQAQADLVPLLRRNADIVIAPSNPQGYIGGLRFNHLHPPFNDVRLRRAVLAAVNQEDYMRAIMGDDHSAWRICRSQYPCGTTYGTEVDLPVQKGDLEAAKKMIQEAGYNGQKAVIINPTDFATIGPLGDITYDMFKKIGINADLQATDWGSVVQRRATKEPVEKGGWSMFHTWFTGGFILNPVVTAPFRGQGAAGWFGWYDNPKIEQLTQEWLDAKDEDARKKIAAAIQLENYAQVPTVTLGQFQIPTAYRKSLAGKLECTGPLFWNVRRGLTRTAARNGSGGGSRGTGSAAADPRSAPEHPDRARRAADRAASADRTVIRAGSSASTAWTGVSATCRSASRARVSATECALSGCSANSSSERPVTSYSSPLWNRGVSVRSGTLVSSRQRQVWPPTTSGSLNFTTSW